MCFTHFVEISPQFVPGATSDIMGLLNQLFGFVDVTPLIHVLGNVTLRETTSLVSSSWWRGAFLWTMEVFGIAAVLLLFGILVNSLVKKYILPHLPSWLIPRYEIMTANRRR